MKPLFISTFAAAVMLLFGGVNEVNADPLMYGVVGETVTIKDCKETASGALVIPSTYQGKPVTTIRDSAFNGCINLKSITFLGDAPSSFGSDVFQHLPIGATITVTAGAIGFGETYGGLTVQILKKTLKIKTFSKSDSPFSLTFETQSNSTYKIEASDDLRWGEIGEVQGTGSSVEFTDWRKALFQKQYYRLKLAE
ncbi:leucine-rich repeat domain-containing protein [bacterium]|nr:leucine-rich repeat domain-containing protein [bacterium]